MVGESAVTKKQFVGSSDAISKSSVNFLPPIFFYSSFSPVVSV